MSDPFADVSSWDAATAAEWVARLDARSASPDQVRLRHDVLRLAAPRPGETAVEVGCGTGVMLVELARAVGPSGRVVGVEPQPALAQAARDRAVGLEHVSVEEAFAERLPLEEGSVDLALAQTVLIHLQDTEAAIAEMARVVRPGGRVAGIEQDCDTWTIDHPDRDVTRRIVAFNSDHRSADGWRGRQLRRLFADAGLDPEVTPYVHVDTEPGSYLFTLCERISLAAAEAGALDGEEHARWLGQLHAGRFFSSINYYVCVATAPGESR